MGRESPDGMSRWEERDREAQGFRASGRGCRSGHDGAAHAGCGTSKRRVVMCRSHMPRICEVGCVQNS